MHILKKFFKIAGGGGSLAKQKAHSPNGHNMPVVNVLNFKYFIIMGRLFNTSLFAAL